MREFSDGSKMMTNSLKKIEDIVLEVLKDQVSKVSKSSKCCTVVWREWLCWEERTCGSPVLTFPIEKRMNTKLFIDRMAPLYIGETQIRVETNEGDQPVALADWWNEYTWVQLKCYFDMKRCGDERPGVNLSQNELSGNVKETKYSS